MPQAFFQVPSATTGDQILTKRRIAPQTTEGIPAITGFSDFRGNGGPLAIMPQSIPRRILSLTPEPALALTGKIDIGSGPLDMGDVDPANKGLLNMLANLTRKYAITALASSAQQWIFAVDRATAASDYLTILS